MSIRTVTGMVGLVAIAVTIYLESHGHPVAGQCFLWSVFALAAPVGTAAVTGGEFMKAWFWTALLMTAVIHGLLLWSLWARIPFSAVPMVIVLGFIEAVVLAVLCAQIKQWMGGHPAA